MTESQLTRRRILGGIGVGTTALLAGCIDSGAPRADGGGFAYAPAAIEVSTGTIVVWEWTGEGGLHDVTDEGGAFESELTDEAGHTFEHAFERSGTYKYACSPHVTLGMKGVVMVA